ncbi:MAG: ABC transporter ATP-binding protein [Lachnospiraceae bacterium]|nr:ABC transporter ATP-binding protein [Lachnospiraceae bacterium]
MLTIKNLSKTFNKGTINEKQALTNINLELEAGDFVTVIGGNGAGKSTLLNMVAGVFPADSGSITVAGVDVTKLPEHKRAKYLGRVFQDPMMGTASTMWIEENMAIASRRGLARTLRWGISAKQRAEYKKMLAQFGLGLENRLSTSVSLLSGGQRQALTLLMATMRQPKLLLLDEHTAALDPKTAATVLELTDKIVSENHLTTMMITHNMKDAIAHGNRLIMMNNGRIIFDVKGEEKKKLTVEDLLKKFSELNGEEMVNDRMLLAK